MPIPFVALLGAAGRAVATSAARSAIGSAARGTVLSAAKAYRRLKTRRSGKGPSQKSIELASGDILKSASSAAKLASTLSDVGGALDKWKDGLLDSTRSLATYNGQISAANAKLEAGDVRRSVQSGQARAATSKALIESEEARRDAGRAQNDFWANMGNRATTFWNNTNTLISRGVNYAFGFKEKPGDDEQGGRTDEQFARGVEDSNQGYLLNEMANFRPSEQQLREIQRPRAPIASPARKSKR